MTDSLGDYQTENDWSDLNAEQQRNVMATYIINLEGRVEELERKLERVDRDLDVIDS